MDVNAKLRLLMQASEKLEICGEYKDVEGENAQHHLERSQAQEEATLNDKLQADDKQATQTLINNLRLRVKVLENILQRQESILSNSSDSKDSGPKRLLTCWRQRVLALTVQAQVYEMRNRTEMNRLLRKIHNYDTLLAMRDGDSEALRARLEHISIDNTYQKQHELRVQLEDECKKERIHSIKNKECQHKYVQNMLSVKKLMTGIEQFMVSINTKIINMCDRIDNSHQLTQMAKELSLVNRKRVPICDHIEGSLRIKSQLQQAEQEKRVLFTKLATVSSQYEQAQSETTVKFTEQLGVLERQLANATLKNSELTTEIQANQGLHIEIARLTDICDRQTQALEAMRSRHTRDLHEQLKFERRQNSILLEELQMRVAHLENEKVALHAQLIARENEERMPDVSNEPRVCEEATQTIAEPLPQSTIDKTLPVEFKQREQKLRSLEQLATALLNQSYPAR